MKLKMLGLAAVAAAAVMAFIGAGTASATVLCKTTTTPCDAPLTVGSSLDLSLESATSSNLVDTEAETLNKCTGSTAKDKITQQGSSTELATGSLEGLTWTGCTFPTKTVTLGNSPWITSPVPTTAHSQPMRKSV